MAKRAGARNSAHIYFPAKSLRDATLAAVADIAAGYGYTTTRGFRTGAGHVGELLFRIASGEVATVLLSDEERDGAIEALRHFAALPDDEWPGTWPAREAFARLADALEAAREREETWTND